MRIEIMDGSTVINTILATPEFAEQLHPGAWRLAEVQDVHAEPAEPEWAWYIDHGPLTDRLGIAATMAIDTSSAPAFVAIRADFARRKWLHLKDPRVVASINYLAGQPLPGFSTLAQPLLTAAEADAALTTPVAPGENLALRKLYFS